MPEKLQEYISLFNDYDIDLHGIMIEEGKRLVIVMIELIIFQLIYI